MYYIIETQENQDGTAAILTYQETTKNAALSKWHAVLQFAAISSVYNHSCAVLNSELKTVVRESYQHIPEPEVTEVGEEA